MNNRMLLRLGLLVFVTSLTSLFATALLLRRGEPSDSVFAAEMAVESWKTNPEVSNGQGESCPTDMIAYWQLDETSGTTFEERIQGIDASCSGDMCPAFADGLVNGALAFDRIDDQVDAPDHPDFNWLNDDSFSVELWVKTSSCNDSAFLGKHEFGGVAWWLGCGAADNLPTFGLRDSHLKNVWISGTLSIADNLWHHVVGVRDSIAQQNRLYVDGALAASGVVTYMGDFSNDGPVTIGYHADGWFADATIDEVAAYNRVLSPGEIETHYEKGLTGFGYCNLVPIAEGQSYETDMGVSVEITFDYNDPDGPGPYSVTIVDAPGHGTLSGSGLERTYTPDDGFKGVDSFTWRINDGLNDSDVVTTSIDVKGNGENVPPVAVSQSVTTTNKSPVFIELEYSDLDGGSDYTVSIVDDPEHGALSGSGTMWTYTPDTSYVGEDSFSWIVNDGFDDSNAATVSIQVLDGTVVLYMPSIYRKP